MAENLPVAREALELQPISIDQIKAYSAFVLQISREVMEEGLHYGAIPGTTKEGEKPKPTLFKPGAEILCVTFRLNPQYEILSSIEKDELILYNVKCTLFSIDSEKQIASGIGSCNSKEAKYRYMGGVELTDKPVPKEYWDKEKGNRDINLIGGPGHVAKKGDDNKWYIAIKTEKVERKDYWDLVNTILKMAEKRALVAAVLNATAASSIFTQDLEDSKEIIQDAEIISEVKTTSAQSPPPKQTEPAPANPNAPASEKQINFIKGLATKLEYTPEQLAEKLHRAYGKKIDSLTMANAKDCIETFKKALGL